MGDFDFILHRSRFFNRRSLPASALSCLSWKWRTRSSVKPPASRVKTEAATCRDGQLVKWTVSALPTIHQVTLIQRSEYYEIYQQQPPPDMITLRRKF
jgi:hypothetical protein